MTGAELIEADLERYARLAGPEPVIDIRKPDLAEQHRRWSEWWLNWYRQPIQPNGEPQ